MYKIFGVKHIILMVVSLVLIIGLYVLSKKVKFKNICKTLLGIGIVSEVVKIFFYIIKNENEYGGILPKSDLPFQLCSIQIIFILFVVFCKNEKINRAILGFMMPSCLFGGIFAILIPTYSALNSWVITIQYFSYHIAIIVFALHLITLKEFKWNIKDYLYCLVFLLVLMFFAIYINSMMYDGTHSVNFMYVVKPPQDGLPYLNLDKGWFVYILRYMLLIIVCLTLCYIKPIYVGIKNAISKKKDVNTDKIEDKK